MALSYLLVLARETPPHEALDLVRGFVGGRVTDDGRLVVDDRVVVWSDSVTDLRQRRDNRDDWGFDTATEVGFRLSSDDAEARYATQGTMSLAAIRLAHRLDSDAGLSFEGERRIMLRRGGTLTLYDWWPQWHEPEVLAAIPEPYALEPAPPVD